MKHVRNITGKVLTKFCSYW